MTVGFLISYVGLALVYAAATTALLWATARLAAAAGLRPAASLTPRHIPFLLATLFFLFLTQHPFPTHLDCPVPLTDPKLIPFRFLQNLRDFAHSGAPLRQWITSAALLPPLMNFLICAAIGALFTRHSRHWRPAIALALGLTLFAELSQLTGLWGLYPCAYRQFDVDDLILNSLGVLTGFATALCWRRWR